MSTPTTESRVSRLEQDSFTVLEILQDHSGVLQRLDSKVDKIVDDVAAVKEDVAAVKEDVAWIRKKLS